METLDVLLNDTDSQEVTYNATGENRTGTFNLVELLGPKRSPLSQIIPITIIYILIFVTGTVGNIVTCIVITRNKYMHTTTNYYLFNLAVSDLLVLFLGLPQETYTFWSEWPWIFGEAFCIIRTFAAEMSTYASILTITAFTAERYIAICHPLKAHTVSTLSRAVRVIVCIWIISGICAAPMTMQFGIRFVHDDWGNPIEGSGVCNIKQGAELPHSFETATFLFFFAPMTIITVLYILIGVAVRRSQSRISRQDSDGNEMSGNEWRSQQQAKARKAVLKMLVAVVVAFFICWAPFHAQRLIFIYCELDVNNPTVLRLRATLFYISGILYYVSSTINPILYNIMSLKFREAFKNTILGPCRNNGNRQRGNYKLDGSRYNPSESHALSWTEQTNVNRTFHRIQTRQLQQQQQQQQNRCPTPKVNGRPRSKSNSDECLKLSNRGVNGSRRSLCKDESNLLLPEVHITECNGSTAKVHLGRPNSMDLSKLRRNQDSDVWIEPSKSESYLK